MARKSICQLGACIRSISERTHAPKPCTIDASARRDHVAIIAEIVRAVRTAHRLHAFVRMWTAVSLVVGIVVALALAYSGRAWWSWVVGCGLPLARWLAGGGRWGLAIAMFAWLAIAIVSGVPAIRRRLITGPAMKRLGAWLPRMGETERVALEAGTVWWDAELFSGAPDWARIVAFEPQPLSPRERAFLDGPCAALCGMLDDHAIRAAGDLPAAVWSFIKRERFMGMIIPESFGGLGFSASAHSAVITKLASRSAAACVTVMVPNSLGPAELLVRYGTEAQQQFYLPRLAVGDEIPCFALTEPHAGSDAAAIRATGVVCEGSYAGRRVLGMRLSWDKRYITLAPVATVLGLAFKLRDPDHLLGETTELGITCALVPVNTRGVWIGHRHDPMSTPFQNGPTRGTDVFVPLDHIIGGPAMIGQGWRMLMESLSAGRSLSLPADAVGSAQLVARTIGAYASIREQFGLPIGRFEGVQAKLGRIAGTLYWMRAVRTVTAGAVDAGERPGVISAIAKRWSTEALRDVANAAMDIAGGFGICKGRRNVLAPVYEGVPIGITVEGANILTRSLIVFGQGALRCHPYARAEMEAAQAHDVAAFDRAVAGHVDHMLGNAARSLVLAITGGAFARAPVRGSAGAAIRRLARTSAAFALVADAAMTTLGGALKRAETLSGRMADALAWMYIAAATINRHVAEAEPGDDVLFEWATREATWRAHVALVGVIENLPSRTVARALRLCVLPFGARVAPPSDRLTAAAAAQLLDGAAAWRRLTAEMYVPPAHELGLGQLEHALELAVAARPLRTRLSDALRARLLADRPDLLDQAVSQHVLDANERRLLAEAEAAREEAIQVDAYSPATLRHAGPFAAASPVPTARDRERPH
jgi:acyl-CoA dehydrogenase